MEQKLAFDLDGVLAFSIMKRSRYNMNEVYKTCVPLHLEKMFLSSFDSYHIITGRKTRFKNVTKAWLDKNKFNYESIHYSQVGVRKTTDSLAAHKAKYINALGITHYVEDTPNIALKLIPQVPHCKVLLFTNNCLYNIIEEYKFSEIKE